MSKKQKKQDINLYYFDNGQEQEETIDDIVKRRKMKEREKRIEQRKEPDFNETFDFDTETVIGMTNKNKIKKEEQIKKEFRKKQRKRNKIIRRIKLLIKILVLLGIIVGAIVFATCSPIFNIKEIEVVDNDKLSSETIVSLSGISKEQNIFSFISTKAIGNIKQNAYIETAKIKRIIPNKIQIEVQEREPKFSVPILGEFAYINTQGYILEITKNELNLPVIYGTKTTEEQLKVGNRINEEDLGTLEDILKITSVINDNGLYNKVTNIDISNKNDYIIYMKEEKKTIHLGEATNLNNKMLYVIEILEKEKELEGDIFVNGDLNSNFKVYFRQKV